MKICTDSLINHMKGECIERHACFWLTKPFPKAQTKQATTNLPSVAVSCSQCSAFTLTSPLGKLLWD